MEPYLRNLAGDLLNLEINTIIKDNTTNAKMSSTRRVALLDIADRYRALLISYGISRLPMDKEEAPTQAGPPPYIIRWRYGGEFSFIEIKRHAEKGVAFYQRQMDQLPEGNEKAVLNKRIRLLLRLERQSANLIGLFKVRRKKLSADFDTADELEDNQKLPLTDDGCYPEHTKSVKWNNDIALHTINEVEDLELNPEEITLVRKVWEIGTEQVLLQTIVQIDGDITSYMTNQFVEMPENIRKMTLGMHQQSVNDATRFWTTLFKTVATLAGKAFGKIFS